jgi:hypothetical protein
MSRRYLRDPKNLRELMLIDPDNVEGFRLFAKKLFWIDLDLVDEDDISICEEVEYDTFDTVDVDDEPFTLRSLFINDDFYHVVLEKLSEYFSNDGRFIKNRGKAYLIAILYALEFKGFLKKKHSVAEIQEIAASVLATPVSIETAKFTERVIRGKFDEILKLLRTP